MTPVVALPTSTPAVMLNTSVVSTSMSTLSRELLASFTSTRASRISGVWRSRRSDSARAWGSSSWPARNSSTCRTREREVLMCSALPDFSQNVRGRRVVSEML